MAIPYESPYQDELPFLGEPENCGYFEEPPPSEWVMDNLTTISCDDYLKLAKQVELATVVVENGTQREEHAPFTANTIGRSLNTLAEIARLGRKLQVDEVPISVPEVNKFGSQYDAWFAVEPDVTGLGWTHLMTTQKNSKTARQVDELVLESLEDQLENTDKLIEKKRAELKHVPGGVQHDLIRRALGMSVTPAIIQVWRGVVQVHYGEDNIVPVLDLYD